MQTEASESVDVSQILGTYGLELAPNGQFKVLAEGEPAPNPSVIDATTESLTLEPLVIVVPHAEYIAGEEISLPLTVGSGDPCRPVLYEAEEWVFCVSVWPTGDRDSAVVRWVDLQEDVVLTAGDALRRTVTFAPLPPGNYTCGYGGTLREYQHTGPTYHGFEDFRVVPAGR